MLTDPICFAAAVSDSFRKDLAASCPLFGDDQLAWLQEALNNREARNKHTNPSMTQVNMHFE